jgi:hypothetical protein
MKTIINRSSTYFASTRTMSIQSTLSRIQSHEAVPLYRTGQGAGRREGGRGVFTKKSHLTHLDTVQNHSKPPPACTENRRDVYYTYYHAFAVGFHILPQIKPFCYKLNTEYYGKQAGVILVIIPPTEEKLY